MKDLYDSILNQNNLEVKSLCDLQTELEEEVKKPINVRNFDKIQNLTIAISKLNQLDEFSIKNSAIKYLHEDNINHIKFRYPIKKIISVITCIAVITLSINVFSFTAWGTNAYNAMVKICDGSIKLDFNSDNISNNFSPITLPTSKNDTYGINQYCSQYGFDVQKPTYLPDGFKLYTIDDNVNSSRANIAFNYYDDNNSSIQIVYSTLYDNYSEIGMPSDTYNLEQTKVNGNDCYIQWEDNQMTAIYNTKKDYMVYILYTDGISYEESKKILMSFK